MSTFNESTIANDQSLRPTHTEIDLGRLSENFQAIRQRVGAARIMPILKANAYGHGLLEIARHMVVLGADYLGVAVLEEGILLRQAGIKLPILVLGGILGNQVPRFIEHNLTLTASSVEKLGQIDAVAAAMRQQAIVHLKIDTGMERIGVHYFSAEPLLEAALTCEHCLVEGIYSHFANSDAADLSSAAVQLERFMKVLEFYEARGIKRPLAHIANSGAILQIEDSFLDMVRPGILLFGVYPTAELVKTVRVRPVLSWKSQVVYFKVVAPGHPVSYGSTWQSDKLTRVVTIPVGYGDGYFRSLSNRAEMIIRGKRYPVIGRVCMDQTMVSIHWETAYNGDEVVLLGESGEVVVSCEELAQWAGTIPYEILTNINTRVPRVYLNG